MAETRTRPKLALYDGNGRQLWLRSPRGILTESEYESLPYVRVREELGMFYSEPEYTSTAKEAKDQLFGVDGKVTLEADWITTSNGAPVVLARDRLHGVAAAHLDQTRALLWRDGHWQELARHPSLAFNYSIDYTPEDREQATLLCGFEVESQVGKSQYGVLQGDLRWRLLDWDGADHTHPAIANAPGSQPGDPPVFTGEAQPDGAWLAVWETDRRAVLAGGLWGLQAADGHWLVEPCWTEVFDFDGNTVLGIDPQGRQSIVDLDGRVRLAPVAADVTYREMPDDAETPATFIASPGDDDGDDDDDDDDAEKHYGWLNAQGDWVVPPVYQDYLRILLDDGTRVIAAKDSRTGLLGLLDANGTQLQPPRYQALMYLGGTSWYAETPDEAARSTDDPKPPVRNISPVYRWHWTEWHQGARILNFADDQIPPVDLNCELFVPMDEVGYLAAREGKVALVDLQGQDIIPATHNRLKISRNPNIFLASDWPSDAKEPLDAWDTGKKWAQDDTDHPKVYIERAMLPFQLFDLRTRSWLPQTLLKWKGDIALRRAEDGCGLLQADFQTIWDYRTLGLPGPLESLSGFKSGFNWHPTQVPCDTPIYHGAIGDNEGLFLADGRLLVPFICSHVEDGDARFIHLGINGQAVLMDRAGRLFAPGGETTWAALGAPGFVPGQRGSPAAAAEETGAAK